MINWLRRQFQQDWFRIDHQRVILIEGKPYLMTSWDATGPMGTLPDLTIRFEPVDKFVARQRAT